MYCIVCLSNAIQLYNYSYVSYTYTWESMCFFIFGLKSCSSEFAVQVPSNFNECISSFCNILWYFSFLASTSLQECAIQANFKCSVPMSDFGGTWKEKPIHKAELPLVLSLTRCVNFGKFLLFALVSLELMLGSIDEKYCK